MDRHEHHQGESDRADAFDTDLPPTQFEEHGPFEQDEALWGDDAATAEEQAVAAAAETLVDNRVLGEDADATRAAEAGEPPLALYRRYRPDTFSEVIGQDHVTVPLRRALANNRVNHAYLFSGPRGCGKTTSARILARALNCEQGPTAEPCGECRSCRDLARGGPGSIDVIEIDAASHGGVDDARDLRERAFFAPVQSRYKVYIVDEAHMVTTAGFNALLKVVEEPPPHVKFIFATTEPDKVIGTIRSRTHHYPFRLVPPKILTAYLATLCEAEGIRVEPAVLPLVVRAGAGSVRDSLSVLDQLLGGADVDGVSYAQAATLLGYTPDSLLDEVVDAFAAGDGAGVFGGIDKIIEVGQDPRRFAEDLLRRLRDLLVVAKVPDAISSGLIDVAGDQAERLRTQAAALGPGELTRAAEVIAKGLTDMRGTTAPRLHLELMCSRVLLPGADVGDRGVHARLDRLERRLGMDRTEVDAPPAGQRAPAPGIAQPTAAVAVAGLTTGENEPDSGTQSSAPASGQVGRPPVTAEPPSEAARPSSGSSVDEPPPAAALPPAREAQHSSREPVPMSPAEAVPPADRPASGDAASIHTEATPDAAQPPGLSTADVRRLWPDVLERVKAARRFTWVLLSQNAQVADVSDGTLTLTMPNVGARESFSRGGSDAVLHDALRAALGVDLKVAVTVDAESSALAGGVGASRPAQTRPSTPPAPTSAAPTSAPPSVAASPSPSMPGPAPHPTGPATPSRSASAREQIRPTRTDAQRSGDEPEEEFDPSDGIAEESLSPAEILTKHLGAELMGDESAGDNPQR